MFLVMMLVFVSFGSHSLAALNTCAKHARLELCSRDYDCWSTHNPESLEEGVGVTGRRPGPEAKPPKQGDVAPNLPTSGGEETLTLQGGEEVS